jgi:hypothetical protein
MPNGTVSGKQSAVNSEGVVGGLRTADGGLSGGGQPLPRSARDFFEPRFGFDFGHVRLHTDAKAAESARAVNAQAYTVGHDVMFAAGQYKPGTMNGNRLLAHELTHVVQQSWSPGLMPGLQRQPANVGKTAQADDCSGWEQDPESFSIHVARYVAKMQIDPSLVVKASPGGKLAECKDSRHCDVLFSNGLIMRVAWEPSTRIALGRWDSKGRTLRSIYTYSCPGGQLVLKFKDFTRGSE